MCHVFIACVSVVNYQCAYFGVSAANDSAAAAPGGSGSSSRSMGSWYVSERLQWPGVLVLGYRQECGYLQCAIDEDKLCVRVGVWNRGKEGNERQDSEREREKIQRQPKRLTQPL